MANKTLNNFIVYTLVQFQIFIIKEILCSLWLSEDPWHCSNFAFGISAMTCKTQMQSYGIAVVPVSSSDQSTTDVVREFISSRCGETVSQFHKKSKSFLVTISTGHKLKPDCLCHPITCTQMLDFFFLILVNDTFKSQGWFCSTTNNQDDCNLPGVKQS